MIVQEMEAVCREIGILPEDRQYLQKTGLPVDELGIPKSLQREIVSKIEDGSVDGFRFAGGVIITALGGVQMRREILQYADPLFPGFGRLSIVGE